jgi:hypothetical protein
MEKAENAAGRGIKIKTPCAQVQRGGKTGDHLFRSHPDGTAGYNKEKPQAGVRGFSENLNLRFSLGR